VNHVRLIESIKHHEGLRLRVYTDTAGVSTIGYGRNLQDVGISEWMADAMLHEDISAAALSASRVVGSFNALTDGRQEVLVEMAFNLGAVGLAKFTKTLQFIADEQWEHAAAEMLDSRWAQQVGQRAVRLSRKFMQG